MLHYGVNTCSGSKNPRTINQTNKWRAEYFSLRTNCVHNFCLSLVIDFVIYLWCQDVVAFSRLINVIAETPRETTQNSYIAIYCKIEHENYCGHLLQLESLWGEFCLRLYQLLCDFHYCCVALQPTSSWHLYYNRVWTYLADMAINIW